MAKEDNEEQQVVDEITIIRRITNALDALSDDKTAQERVINYLNAKYYPKLKIAAPPPEATE